MKILIVEDEDDLREAIRRSLVTAGYEVSSAGDGIAAFILMASESFELLVTDILMPGRDGLEVIKEFHRRFPSKGIVAMSGGSDLFEGVLCLDLAKRLGADEVLNKPFGIGSLLETVKRATREK